MQSMNFRTLEEINPNPDSWPRYVPHLEGGQRPNTAARQLPRAGGNLTPLLWRPRLHETNLTTLGQHLTSRAYFLTC